MSQNQIYESDENEESSAEEDQKKTLQLQIDAEELSIQQIREQLFSDIDIKDPSSEKYNPDMKYISTLLDFSQLSQSDDIYKFDITYDQSD